MMKIMMRVGKELAKKNDDVVVSEGRQLTENGGNSG